MKLSFITDEFTQSLEESIDFAIEYDYRGVELRSVENRSLHDFSLAEVIKWKEKLDLAGLKVSNLASNFFKCEFNDRCIEQEYEKLEKLCKIADLLNCRTIRGFSFLRNNINLLHFQEIATAFYPATRILQKYNKVLLLEADPSVNATNHFSLSKLLSFLDRNYYGAVYDPGNCLFDPYHEIPFPDGYDNIRSFLKHIHIKDAIFMNKEPICVSPGSGLVDYYTLLKEVKNNGYSGWLSLEPHYRKDTILTEEQMRVPSGSDFSKGGTDAMIESTLALKKLLNLIN